MRIAFILMRIYEALTALLPAFITYVILNRPASKRIKNPSNHLPMFIIFAIYIAATLYFTGAGTIYHINMYGLKLDANQLNLVPFSQGIDAWAYFANILLMVPLGFLLPCIWPRHRSLLGALLAGLGYSLLIELSQLFNMRATDVDDLIMNAIGAVAGYLFYRLFAIITHHCSKRSQYIALEPAIYIAAMFMGHFLLYDGHTAASILYT